MDFPGKNTGVDCHFLLQRIFLTQESNLGLLHCRQILYQLVVKKVKLVAQRLKCLLSMWGDLGSIPGSERSPGEGNGNPLQYSCLENPMDRGSWWAAVHGITKSRTRLSDFTFTFFWASLLAQRLKHLPAMRETWVPSLGWEDPLEKEMAIHSSIFAWTIPWREEPGRLQSMRSQRVGHD